APPIAAKAVVDQRWPGGGAQQCLGLSRDRAVRELVRRPGVPHHDRAPRRLVNGDASATVVNVATMRISLPVCVCMPALRRADSDGREAFTVTDRRSVGGRPPLWCGLGVRDVGTVDARTHRGIQVMTQRRRVLTDALDGGPDGAGHIDSCPLGLRGRTAVTPTQPYGSGELLGQRVDLLAGPTGTFAMAQLLSLCLLGA